MKCRGQISGRIVGVEFQGQLSGQISVSDFRVKYHGQTSESNSRVKRRARRQGHICVKLQGVTSGLGFKASF